MKKKTIKTIMWIVIYLAPCYFNYIYLKQDWIKDVGHWTIGDRSGVILYSSFSWLTLPTALLAKYNVDIYGTNPANW